MARTLEQYSELVLMLLPRGDVWSRDGELAAIATAIAEECVRVELLANQLIEESDTRSVVDLIDEWETDWGLPTQCTGPLATLQLRRDALTTRFVGIANQSRQTYIDRAASVGYAITITEYSAGDAVPALPSLPAPDSAFAVRINAPLDTVQQRVMGSPMGEAFASWGNELLECTLNEIQQSHHILIYSYT